VGLKYLEDVKSELKGVFEEDHEWLKYEWAGFCSAGFEFEV